MFDAFIKLLDTLIGRTSYDNFVEINLTQDYVLPTGFFLYVGVSGTVSGVDWTVRSFSRTLIAGYHLFKCKQINQSGTTATNLAACF